MPNFPLSDIIPPYPQHWTTILHYVLLLGAIAMLGMSGDKSSMFFTFIVAALALFTAADLYIGLISIPQFVVFMLRVGMFGLPVILAGLAPTEQVRSVGIVLAFVALPLFVLTFLTCPLGGYFMDPRIQSWCS